MEYKCEIHGTPVEVEDGQVTPCPACIREAEIKGGAEGYSEGLSQGKIEAYTGRRF